MAWHDAPRKPNGVDRLRQRRESAEALALEKGWGRLVSTGETRDSFIFNFEDGTQVWYTPELD